MTLQTTKNNFTTLLLITINYMLHQLSAAGLQIKDIYLEQFYSEHSNVTWEEFFNGKILVMDRYLFEY